MNTFLIYLIFYLFCMNIETKNIYVALNRRTGIIMLAQKYFHVLKILHHTSYLWVMVYKYSSDFRYHSKYLWIVMYKYFPHLNHLLFILEFTNICVRKSDRKSENKIQIYLCINFFFFFCKHPFLVFR